MKSITEAAISEFRSMVYAKGRELYRDLPWRKVRDPYLILLSELMLQQTQVCRVQKHWDAFLCRFPSLSSLAAAQLSCVLEAWQGLGYSRRALNLHKSAQIIMRDYGGKVPRETKALCSLPGIGAASAAGVRVFAFSIPDVYLETNVRSVFLHEFFSGKSNVSDAELVELIKQCLPSSQPRLWYYALLDYGAYLKKIYSNPSRKSKHYTRQSPYKGSRRQKRAFLLRCLLEAPASSEELLSDLNSSERQAACEVSGLKELEAILRDLAGEGFIEKAGVLWQIA